MRWLLALLMVLLFTSSITVNNIGQVNAASPLPEYRLYGDGEGSTVGIQWDGAKFTLTQNIEGTITIMSNNTVVDGSGFTVMGRGDATGITVYDKTNVTIKDVIVKNFSIGILLGHYSPDAFLWYDPNPNRCTNCTVSNCQLSNNTKGLSIVGGIQCRIIGNQATNNEKGITFFGSGNIFKNNRMENNSNNFEDNNLVDNDIDQSNTVNGKPIYYLTNRENMTVPTDASIVVLKNCLNVTVQSLNLSYVNDAIALINTNNSTVYNNFVANNDNCGITLRNSTNITMSHNHIVNNKDSGIELHYSENVKICNNLIRANGEGIGDIYATTSKNIEISDNLIIENTGGGIRGVTECRITGNYIFGNGGGVFFSDSTRSIISRNNITGNADYGISVSRGTGAVISNNSISKNRVGINFGYPSKITVTRNEFSENREMAIKIDGYAVNNRFLNNNFIGNNNNSLQAAVKGIWVYEGDERYIENSSGLPQCVAGYANLWNDGKAGNYWSDYNLTNNGEYKIDDNNIDHLPQKIPFQFDELKMPIVGLQNLLNSTNDGSSEPINNGNNDATWTSILAALAVGVIASVILYRWHSKKHQGYSASA